MKHFNKEKVIFKKGLASIEQTKEWLEKETLQLPAICFIGRSNVGKSSLINSLFGKKTAKVSQTPGKTREINLFFCEVVDKEKSLTTPFWLIDLPGYGYAKASKEVVKKWQNLMEYFFSQIPSNFLMISMRDARHPDQRSDQNFTDFLQSHKRESITVLNKFDKLKTQKEREQLKKFTALLKKELNNKNLMISYMSHPLMSFKIIGAIHFEALKLWLKGVKLVKRKLKIKNNITFEI